MNQGDEQNQYRTPQQPESYVHKSSHISSSGVAISNHNHSTTQHKQLLLLNLRYVIFFINSLRLLRTFHEIFVSKNSSEMKETNTTLIENEGDYKKMALNPAGSFQVSITTKRSKMSNIDDVMKGKVALRNWVSYNNVIQLNGNIWNFGTPLPLVGKQFNNVSMAMVDLYSLTAAGTQSHYMGTYKLRVRGHQLIGTIYRENTLAPRAPPHHLTMTFPTFHAHNHHQISAGNVTLEFFN